MNELTDLIDALAHESGGGKLSEPVAAQLIAGFAVLLASLLGGEEGEQ